MGLLDFFDQGTPEQEAAKTAMARGLLGSGSNLQRMAGGMGAYQDTMAKARLEAEARKMREQQLLMQQLQMQQAQEQMRRQAAAEEAAAKDEGLMRRLAGMPLERQQAPGQMGPGLPQQNPGIDPRTFLNQGGSMGGLSQAMSLSQALTPQREKPIVSKPGDIARGPDGSIMWQNPDTPPAPDKPDEFMRALAAAGVDPNSPQGRQMAFQRLQKLATHQPGTSVNVNTGQKGLDNTLKLRGDFRSEPIYKAHQDVLSAHAQITSALKQASPAGDLAGATKLMKILDPGSVVRESELGMAMAASGAIDRLSNYANMVMTGQKLTPTQRKDFQKLADSLEKESARLYSAKRNEYAGIVKRNGLNEDDVLGPAGASNGGWSMERVGP